MTNTSVRDVIEQAYLRFQEEFFTLLRIPSISPVPGYEADVMHCAQQFAHYMNEVGIQTKVYETEGNPIVFGQTEQKPGRPTILIYGHYDVQPEGDVSLWDSNPYEPEIRNGRIYARGTGDNKGQIFAHVKGYEVYKSAYGEPNVNLKFMIEGEEESGSVQMHSFAEKYREMLKADVTIWSDAGLHTNGSPIVLLGLKGIASMKIHVKGPNRDIHSQFSSVLPNPVWKLTKILSSLKDEKGNVLVPGFYDGAIRPSEKAMDAIRAIPGTLQDYRDDWGVDELVHDVDKEQFYSRYMYEPTLNCGCICAGDPTASKNIIPYEASAWLDIRTVPNQTHVEVCEKIKDYILSLGISGVSVEYMGNSPAYTDMGNPFVQPTVDVLRQVWKREPILYPALGGSGPFHVFNVIIGAPCIMVPFADAEQHEHGPNESIPVECFKLGIETSVELLRRFGEN